MQRVELRTAYVWNCEKCSAENWARARLAEMTDADREWAYREFHDLEEWAELPENWRDFEMVQVPETVTCAVCHTEFLAIDESSE